MTEVELASYVPEQRVEYLRLLDEAWGERGLGPAEFDWWFDGNPAGSLRSVALAGEQVVGVAGHSLLWMILEGEPRLATFSVHATTDPSFRGRGIFAGLERKHEREAQERGAAVVLAFASKPTAPIFLGPLGWREVGRLRIWARPLRTAPRDSPSNADAPLGTGPRDSPSDVAPPDAAAEDLAAPWPNHVVRDSEHLGWRYERSPRGYSLIRRGRGYAVLGRKGIGRSRVAVLADLVAQPGEARALLREAVARAGGRALIALPAPEHRAAYLSLGFVPTPRSLHFMGKALAGRLNPDPRAWRFTLGDTDFF